MARYRGICISGDAGSGKTTAARLLLERLPAWEAVSTGGRFRAYCDERGLDPQKIYELPDEVHREFDRVMEKHLRGSETFVAEGRLVCYLAREMDDVLRVWCDCPAQVRAARVSDRDDEPPAAALARLRERDAGDVEKFRALYGIDYHDPRFYTLTIDTNDLGPAAVVSAIVAALEG